MIENEEDIQDSEVDGCDSKEINSQAKAMYPGFFQHSTKDSVCSVYELAPASAGKLEAGHPCDEISAARSTGKPRYAIS